MVTKKAPLVDEAKGQKEVPKDLLQNFNFVDRFNDGNFMESQHLSKTTPRERVKVNGFTITSSLMIFQSHKIFKRRKTLESLSLKLSSSLILTNLTTIQT